MVCTWLPTRTSMLRSMKALASTGAPLATTPSRAGRLVESFQCPLALAVFHFCMRR